MRIYLASPISSNPEAILWVALENPNQIIDKGHNPYIPNLMYYLEERKEREYETWMTLDEEWLVTCEAVYRIPGESPGADREMKLAVDLGLLVIGHLDDLDWLTEPPKSL
jgi:hypothetical protein